MHGQKTGKIDNPQNNSYAFDSRSLNNYTYNITLSK